MFIKVAVRELEPSTLVAARLVLAALTLLVIVAVRLPLRAVVGTVRGRAGAFLLVVGPRTP